MRRLFSLLFLAGLLYTDAAVAQQPMLTNSIGMEFVRIEPGTMLVGRFQPACPEPPTGDEPLGPSRTEPEDPRAEWTAEDYAACEEMARRDALPGFTVTIERPYYIGRYEVTQTEWKRVMGANPSVFQGSRVDGNADRHPVDNVTWEDVQAFVEKLNDMEGSAVYRLPTEFEWEYAARAGAEQELPWAEIREQGWIMDVDKGTTHPVGGKKPNPWGLYDTIGNVWEWVEDYYNEKLFADPVPPRTGRVHVLRGGGFLSDVKNATYFTHAGGPGSGFDVGFRIVREVSTPDAQP